MKHEAILNLYPSVVGVTDDNAYDKDGNLVSYDNTNVNKEILRLQTEYDAQEYARYRKEEYPPMEDQLDYIYHEGIDKWKVDMIDPVKDKYPKPE